MGARASEGVRRCLGEWPIPRDDILSLLGSWHIHVPLGPFPQATTDFRGIPACHFVLHEESSVATATVLLVGRAAGVIATSTDRGPAANAVLLL